MGRSRFISGPGEMELVYQIGRGKPQKSSSYYDGYQQGFHGQSWDPNRWEDTEWCEGYDDGIADMCDDRQTMHGIGLVTI